MKKIFIYIIVFIVFGSFSTHLTGDEFKKVEDPKVLVNKLDSLAKHVQSIKSDFVQLKHISVLEEDIRSNGRFLFLKPANIKWSYLDPINYEISIVNETFKIKNDGKVSEYDTQSNKIFGEINTMIISMLNGSILTNESFHVDLFQNSLFYKAVLIPSNKDFKRFISEIHIYFNKSDFMVSKIRMVEASGDYTIISFQNRVLNSKLSISELGFN